MSFGPDFLVGQFKAFGRIQPKMDSAWLRWATRSLFHNKTSLIGHIWRTWNGPAATDEVLWLQNAPDFLVGQFQAFGRIQPKNGLSLAEMDHQELVSQQNITHWSHMEGMEWSSSNR
jgi:hypothetical protein